jgi:multiple sugar transport system permease protein
MTRLTDRTFGVTLLVPAVLLVALLFAYPIGYSIYMGFHNKDIFSTKTAPYVGMENFRNLMNDETFWNAFKNGLIYAFATVLFHICIGIPIALLLNIPFVGRSLARGLVMLPYVVPAIGAALIWKWLYNDMLGLVNYLLILVGLISKPIAWIGDRKWAMVGVTVVGAWKFFPFVVLCVLARLQTIPRELYDAARVDGASAFNRFKDITIPQLREILFVVILLRFVWMFNEFEMIWLLTKGGPMETTTTLPVLAYMLSFVNFDLSLGMAVTVFMLVFLLIMYLIYSKIYRAEGDI